MQRHFSIVSFLAASLLFFVSNTHLNAEESLQDLREAAPNWELVVDDPALQIFTAPYRDSSFRAFKALTHINAPLASVLAVIADPESCPLWVDGCLASRNLELVSFDDRYGYALSHLPWPFKNREVVVHIVSSNDKKSGQVNIDMQTDKRFDSTLDDNAIRIEDSHSRYLIRPLSANSCELVWMQHTEPAGSLPAWLVNAMVIDLPKNSLPKLKSLAKQDRYQNVSLQYDKNHKINGLTLKNGERINHPE